MIVNIAAANCTQVLRYLRSLFFFVDAHPYSENDIHII